MDVQQQRSPWREMAPWRTAEEQGAGEGGGGRPELKPGDGRVRGKAASQVGGKWGLSPHAERSQGREEDRGQCCQGNCTDREHEMVKGKDGRTGRQNQGRAAVCLPT